MVLIILAAFGNFFYVENKTLKEGETRYTSQYFNSGKDDYGFFDAVLSVYVFGPLGFFNQPDYFQGYSKVSVGVMFIAGTFFTRVVFMNMLIAIMSNTFAEVQEHAEMNTLGEQIQIMNDFMWLLNLERVFEG